MTSIVAVEYLAVPDVEIVAGSLLMDMVVVAVGVRMARRRLLAARRESAMTSREFGAGYSRDPLEGDDAAKTRQATQEWEDFRETSRSILALARFMKILPFIIAAGVFAGVYIASQGMLGGPTP
jgi:hypothetical protein